MCVHGVSGSVARHSGQVEGGAISHQVEAASCRRGPPTINASTTPSRPGRCSHGLPSLSWSLANVSRSPRAGRPVAATRARPRVPDSGFLRLPSELRSEIVMLHRLRVGNRGYNPLQFHGVSGRPDHLEREHSYTEEDILQLFKNPRSWEDRKHFYRFRELAVSGRVRLFDSNESGIDRGCRPGGRPAPVHAHRALS